MFARPLRSSLAFAKPTRTAAPAAARTRLSTAAAAAGSRPLSRPPFPSALPQQQVRYAHYKRFGGSSTSTGKDSTILRNAAVVIVGSAFGFYVYHLETVPGGRRRFNTISKDAEAKIAKAVYEETMRTLEGSLLPQSHPASRRVRRVLERLVPVCGLEGLDWEVHVVNDPQQMNAFVIPGGKVFIFSGMLALCEDDDSLATVLSHEIAHTVARHIAEKLSRNLLVLPALLGLAIFLGDFGPVAQFIIQLVFVRPGSRTIEVEADKLGLFMMAQACYDPGRAVVFWERMERVNPFEPPQFISTHPSYATRIRNIRGWLPEARAKRSASDCHDMLDYAAAFLEAFQQPKW